MDRRGAWLTAVVVTALVTVPAFGVLLFATGFVACGISGCSGGGFGPTFAPRQAQVGLLLAGVALVPLALVAMRGRRRGHRAAGAVAMVAVGSVLAMLVLGLGPNGCPWGQSQARVGPDGFTPGSLTCSADRDAVPPGDSTP